MQIVCKNCRTKYDVSDTEIPDFGREVECSSCGTIWFQPSKVSEPLLLTSSRQLTAAQIKPSSESEAEQVQAGRKPGLWDALETDRQIAGTASGSGSQNPIQHSQKTLKILQEEVQHAASTKSKDRHRNEQLREQSKALVVRQDVKNTETLVRTNGVVVKMARRNSRNSSRIIASSQRKPGKTNGTNARSKSRRALLSAGMFLIALLVAFALVHEFTDQLGALFPALTPSLATYKEVADQAWSWIMDLIGS